jgi:hypothetical protein
LDQMLLAPFTSRWIRAPEPAHRYQRPRGAVEGTGDEALQVFVE